MIPDFQRWQRVALASGLILLVLCVLSAFIDVDQFFRSYLIAYLFWLGVCLGSLATLMMQHLMHGRWSLLVRRILEASTRTIPLMAVLTIPLFFGMHRLYIWSHADVVAHDSLLQKKRALLNPAGFTIRAFVYFAIWMILIYLLNKWSAEQDRTGSPEFAKRMNKLSGPGLILYAITVTLASLDWIMSMQPAWYSTIFGALVMMAQILSAVAFTIFMLIPLKNRNAYGALFTASALNNLGNILLTFVILWTYMAFSQFLIIWAGNLPEEITWYLVRTNGGWQWYAILLIAFQFAVPLAMLLFREVKRNVNVLGGLAACLLVIRLVDLIWIVEPVFHPSAMFSLLDLGLPLAIGGLWMAMFLRELQRMPLVPEHDPLTPELQPQTGGT